MQHPLIQEMKQMKPTENYLDQHKQKSKQMALYNTESALF